MDDREHTPAAAGGATATGAARVMAAIFGVAFGGIGLSVISFLWFGEDGFGGPPLVFRLVGSFIALVFVGFGGFALYGAITGRAPAGHASAPTPATPPGQSGGPTPGGYRCPNCGAPLGQGADVSPMGDVKCTFCKTWFNVHGRRSA